MERYRIECKANVTVECFDEKLVGELKSKLENLGGKWVMDADENYTYFYGSCKGTYTFYPGRRWMDNGDPGYPDEESYNIDFLEDDVKECVMRFCNKNEIDYWDVEGELKYND